jgi:hypothetical protein
MKPLIGILTTFFAVFAPIQGLILLLTMLVGIDTIFAIYVAIKLKGRNEFKSNKLFNIVIKTFFYVGSLLILFMVDKFVFAGTLFGITFLLSKVTSLFWCYVELKSVDEKSMKLGNRSVWVILVEGVRKYHSLKKDLSDKEKKENN